MKVLLDYMTGQSQAHTVEDAAELVMVERAGPVRVDHVEELLSLLDAHRIASWHDRDVPLEDCVRKLLAD